MSKSLVIVESPNKVKTISKILGSDYIVSSSVGHIRDLPKSGSSKLLTKKTSKTSKTKGKKETTASLTKAQDTAMLKMGIKPYTWQADYQIMPDKIKVVNDLKKLAASADHIYLATDLDREGEAIAWHLYEVLKDVKKDQDFSRITFNEITAKAVKAAISNPHSINMNYVNAQQTRRFLDRMVGFLVSPLLWKKVSRGLSAGRVQSVATKLIVEREREIASYKSIEFWKFTATSDKLPEEIIFELDAIADRKITHPETKNPFFIANQEQAEQLMAQLNGKIAKVRNIEEKEQLSRPYPPFTTATLQRAASSLLGFSIKRTMIAAQRLYEAGLITYMRTDSTNLSQSSLEMARDWIMSNLGKDYLPSKANIYATKGDHAQEAHEAIRPTDLKSDVAKVAGLTSDHKKVYDLILKRFLASQATPAVFKSTNVVVGISDNPEYSFKTSARVMTFAGWHKIIPTSSKDLVLSNFEVGQEYPFKYDMKQSFTNGPSRYTEASLVKELESRSIGRPSTYVAIISTIQERNYVRLEDKKFYATEIAQVVTDNLECNFDNLLNYGFTASMEDNLDRISQGEEDWKVALDGFYGDLTQRLDNAQLEENQGGMPSIRAINTEIPCPKSPHFMSVRLGTNGVFLGCMGYYEEDSTKQCSHTQSLTLLTGDENSPYPGLTGYQVDSKQQLYIDYHNQQSYIVTGDFKIEGTPEVESIPCDKCYAEEGGVMTFKSGRFGNYMGCDKCKNTRRILANGEISPPKKPVIEYPEYKCSKSKDAYFVIRNSSRGIFFSPNNFPRTRDKLSTHVHLLQKYPDRLWPELRYLLSAPAKDPEGNDTQVSFDTKNEVQYISSLNSNNKRTKYRADYIDGVWVETTS